MCNIKYRCCICKGTFNKDTENPLHFGPGGFTLFMGEMTGDIICDECLTWKNNQEEKALNDALESSLGD